jgi:CheY-like chemotaxis protein
MILPDGKFILHIDDDEDDRQLVREAIAAIDSRIVLHQARDGHQGLQFLKEAKQLNSFPCLIILDINLPGIDGKQVLKEIRQDRSLAELPLVLFTTSSSPIDKLFAQKHNVELFTKPHKFEAVPEAIRELLLRCAEK